ncbi:MULTISPECIES: alpha/beta fold hydrolase [unclassified Paracoccus (in: a-proteobacteria)]|uniref:alpha/beta fold hydrolase n=1 Tax=unclassified Paracoccus (in: a-proteobacteria) TaxID=2688777 RepID=UPI0015FF02A2|nr:MULTISPECIES: alpha/beta fold hydrolase [unclassified Paracoccus (in: a-proteobacteria)]MBB1492327.1 alpha/beta fold hydrolase [Paracoccus sp. MC1854]MBB1498406.1 alpha/beta fold hydrolase [Paracoccus sp. MC1862]QQO46677.1 alpha/beta fold hydrolase [Paracoccus sp. MC1862]
MRWVEVNGKLLRHRHRPGRGPCLILLHEMGGSIESWDLVLPHLAPDQACLIPEMRGMGMSERVRGDFAMTDLAADLFHLITHLGIEGPVVLSGCAVGGAVALQFALDHPDRAAGVVPLDPALDTRPENVAAVRALADRMETEGLRAVEPLLLDRTYPQPYRDADPDHFAAVRGRWMANDPGSFAAYLRMLSRTDLFPRLGEVACPVILGSGEDDVLRPPEYVARVAQAIPGAEVVSLRAGHHLPDHAPEGVAGILNEMLRRVGDGAPPAS